ncbi:MAG: hypothetical protein ACR2H1_06280 [Limisphaerales bacterium]
MKKTLINCGLVVFGVLIGVIASRMFSTQEAGIIPEVHTTNSLKGPVRITPSQTNVGRTGKTNKPLVSQIGAISIDITSKQEMLKHNAEILRSAITSEMEQTYRKSLKDEYDALNDVEWFAAKAVSFLNETSTFLTDANLEMYLYSKSYSAVINNPKDPSEYYDYVFSSADGWVTQIEKTGKDGPISGAFFYENGKLKLFERIRPDREMLAFKENGDFDFHWVKRGEKEFSVQVDEAGKLRRKGYPPSTQ